ncbi:hypothetical protein [Glycomyces buryatensis]|uniref:Uncharacterized protein n=1 Tax=Glycomyces buryatensis TaxID=2570927 RepID=A0A4S8QGG1_9ACTN|nr:hypothetical protein [Glycomyces buryatensis]THV42801.1 hypothetical protein FAB82_04605 [Glycomyces buryatensis]
MANSEPNEEAVPEAAAAPEADGNRPVSVPRWVDLTPAIMMSLAAVGTAWAGFQSAKWSGVQANSYAQAGAVRVESNRASTDAGQERLMDVVSFTSWLNALNQEILAGTTPAPDGSYEPDARQASGFMFERFRPDFQVAVEAWLDTRPLITPDAPPTPFDMPEYQLDSQDVADDFQHQAEDLSATAREANQRSDNYVLTAVIFALVLFFAGVGSRARAKRPLMFLTTLGIVALVCGALLLLTLPVEV